MSTALKLCFPPYWAWFFVAKPVIWGVKKVVEAPKKAITWWYNSKYWPKSYVGKAVAFSIAGFIAIPGSIPWLFYQTAKAVGYEREAEAVMDWLIGMGMWAWDMIVWSAKVAEKVVNLAMMMV